MVMCCKVGGGCCQEPDDNEPQQHCVWCEEIDRERVDRPGGPGGDSTSSFQGNKVKGGGLLNTTILVSSITMFYHDQYHLCSGERREAQTSYSSGNKLGKHNTKVTWIVQHHPGHIEHSQPWASECHGSYIYEDNSREISWEENYRCCHHCACLLWWQAETSYKGISNK